MSSDNQSGIPSNAEVIEELTKDLKDCAVKADSGTIDNELHRSESSDSETDTQAKETVEIRDEDYIDDDLLKERDEKSSEEQKREWLKNALDLKSEGNIKFKNQEHEEASKIYTDALRICPLMFPNYRAILFANRAAAKSSIHIESAIQDCTRAIELDPDYIKVYIRRSKLYERNDKLDEALDDLKKVLEVDPNYVEAAYNARILQEKINERNEKMKTEMMAKLKDLGNMVLKPFGLSTQNFQVNQDPNTGGYSINFKQ